MSVYFTARRVIAEEPSPAKASKRLTLLTVLIGGYCAALFLFFVCFKVGHEPSGLLSSGSRGGGVYRGAPTTGPASKSSGQVNACKYIHVCIARAFRLFGRSMGLFCVFFNSCFLDSIVLLLLLLLLLLLCWWFCLLSHD